MAQENIKKTLSHSLKNLFFFFQILRKKICVLPNSKGKKNPLYTDKINMSGRYAVEWEMKTASLHLKNWIYRISE